MTCAECLAKAADALNKAAARFEWKLPLLALVGLLLAWIVFYYLGVFLSRMPAEFHGA